MKKTFLLLTGLVLFVTGGVRAQITYEHTYTLNRPGQYNLFVTNLGHNNYKHVIYDYYKEELNLYNLDHTPFMLNIPVPVSDSGAIYSIGYVSSTLFDCDSSNIEYALIPLQPYQKFMIYRIDGTLLFSKDSVQTNYCYGCFGGSVEIHPIVNTPAGAKLYLNKGVPGFAEISVYGLCDSLPVNFIEINQPNSYVQVFPNPSSNEMNFRITAPDNFELYELTILNTEFKTIKTSIIRGETELNLDCKSLSSGTYFYSMQNKNKVLQSGKFILTK